jgi:hypothetical protein
MIPRGHQRAGPAHERKDVDVINLLLIALLLLLIIGICLLVCWGLLHVFNRDRQAQEPPHVRMAQYPQPNLILEPGKEEKRTQLRALSTLETYGWVDRKAAVARIPITRAMQLLLERGLPLVGQGQTRLQLMQARPRTDVQPDHPVISPTPETMR